VSEQGKGLENITTLEYSILAISIGKGKKCIQIFSVANNPMKYKIIFHYISLEICMCQSKLRLFARPFPTYAIPSCHYKGFGIS